MKKLDSTLNKLKKINFDIIALESLGFKYLAEGAFKRAYIDRKNKVIVKHTIAPNDLYACREQKKYKKIH